MVIGATTNINDFLGLIDNLKTDHVNVLATIQLPCQKLFFSYLGYILLG